MFDATISPTPDEAGYSSLEKSRQRRMICLAVHIASLEWLAVCYVDVDPDFDYGADDLSFDKHHIHGLHDTFHWYFLCSTGVVSCDIHDKSEQWIRYKCRGWVGILLRTKRKTNAIPLYCVRPWKALLFDSVNLNRDELQLNLVESCDQMHSFFGWNMLQI